MASQPSNSTTTSSPTYRKLFGDADYYSVDPARSVLSPGAYFVELMQLIEDQINCSDANATLKHRRPDLWDKVTLDSEDTFTEIPKIDLVINVLEKYLTRHGVSFDHLTTVNYPFDLPYDKNIVATRKYLGLAKTSLPEIWSKLAKPALTSSEADVETAIYLETLGISPAQWVLYSTSKTDSTSLAKAYFGDDSTVTDPVVELRNANTFALQCGIDRHKLNELIYQDLSTEELNDNIQAQFFINTGTENPISIKGDQIVGLTLDRLDHIHRFMRLAHTLNWSYTDLDWALYCVAQANGKPSTSIDADAVSNLAWIASLTTKSALSIQQCCAIIWRLKPYGQKNGSTFFDQVFNNPDIANVPDWTTKPSWDPTSNTDAQTQNALASALNLSHTDLLNIASWLSNPITLNNQGLAQLYRLSLLPQTTSLSIKDVLVAIQILPEINNKTIKASLAELSISTYKSACLNLLSLSQELEELPLSINELQFVITGASGDPDILNRIPSGDTLNNFVKEVQQAISGAFLTQPDFTSAMSQSLHEGIVSDLKSLETTLTEESDIIEVKKALADSQNLASTLCDKLYKALSPSYLIHGILLFDSVVETFISDQTTNLLTPSLQAMVPNQTITWTSVSWQDTINKTLDKYLKTQEQVLGSHLTGICQLPPFHAHTLKTWSLKYLRSLEGHNYETVSWTFAVMALVDNYKTKLPGLLSFLQRVAMLVRHFTLSNTEADFLSAAYTYGAPQSISYSSVKEIFGFRSLTGQFSDTQNILLDILKASGSLTDATTLSTFIQLTGWHKSDVQFITGTSQYSALATVSVANIQYLATYLKLTSQLGISPQLLWNLVNLSNAAGSSEDIANGLFGGLQSILGSDSSTLLNVKGALREDYRNKLVALAKLKLNITHSRDLFSYFLLDTEVDGSLMTSKVREAISAVQVYIQRCMNHLEDSVTFSTTASPTIQTLWKWMYSYREWEANREVFLFPENYIEPELRKNTSPEFATLVNLVKHTDRTDPEAYETAFKNYFKDFVRVANIQVLTIARLGFGHSTDHRTFFMVGRTLQHPTEYYYRIASATEQEDLHGNRILVDIDWGYWKKIGSSMHPIIYQDGALCISPKYVFGKWHLFWMEQKMSSSSTSSSPTAGTTTTAYSNTQSYTVNCQYMALDADGNWGPAQTGASYNSKDLTDQPPNYLSFEQPSSPDAQGKYSLNVTCLINPVTGNSQKTFNLKGYVFLELSSTIWAPDQEPPSTFKLLATSGLGESIKYPTGSNFLPFLESAILQKNGIDKLFKAASASNSGVKDDLTSNVPITNYYWELLFHAPFLIAHELQTHQQFIAAKEWYEYIFNPQAVATGTDTGNDRFWKFLGLRPSLNPTLTEELARTGTQDQLHDLVATSQIDASDANPFDPQVIASLRPIAYQKTIFSHYFSNLQSWGDQCMKENTRESLNEAEMIYVMAADLLGQKPEDLGQASSRPSTEYKNVGGGWIPLTTADQSAAMKNISCISTFDNGIWAGTHDAGLWLSTDQGGTWTQKTSPGVNDNGTTYSLVDSSKIVTIAAAEKRVFVIFQSSGENVIFYTKDGNDWKFGFSSDNKVLHPHSIVVSDGIPFVGNKDGQIFQFDTTVTNNWKSVLNLGSKKPIDKLLIQDNHAFFFAKEYYMGVLNGGASNPPTIIPHSAEDGHALSPILAFDGVNIIASSKLTYSSDYNSWSTPTWPGSDGAAFFETNQNSWLIIGRDSRGPGLYYSTDLGQSWTKSVHRLKHDYMQLFCVGETYYLREGTGGNNSSISQSTDNGYSWQQMHISSGNESLELEGLTVVYGSQHNLYVGSENLWSTPLPYFGAPQNLQMLGYWNQINQRLYDINHGLTLAGVPDVMPLFSAEYGVQTTPALGLSAEALEAELGGGLNTIPHYRFSYMIEKAKAACDNLRSLGSALLSAMESKDAAALSNLYIQNEQAIQSNNLLIKKDQISAAQSTLNALTASKDGVQDRINHYRQLIDGGLISDEITQVGQKAVAITLTLSKVAINLLAAYGHLQPRVFGLADGGMEWGKCTEKPADVLADFAKSLEIGSDIAGIHAEHSRREAEWNDQWQVALNDMDQVTHQVNAATHTLDATRKEMSSLIIEVGQKQKVAQFYLQKFTNEQLYQWFITQISTLYFQSYQMALDMAVQADNARKFEQNIAVDAESFINPGYWNNLHQGLLAGEKLYQDLQQMEKHYMDHNSRPLFVEKEISLSRLDHFAFATLITTGSCVFDIIEKDYDFDFPGHYNRRISRVSIYVELQDGISGHINATLTQIANKVIGSDDSANGTNAAQYLLNPYSSTKQQGTKLTSGNTALISDVNPGQSVIMSQGPSDPVMLMIYANDSRYLPFEGTGAVSSWMLDMPLDNNTLDLTKIKDIKMNINYTAYSGNTAFKKAVVDARGAFQGVKPMAMSRQFPEEWTAFVKQTSPKALSFEIDPRDWRANGETYQIDSIKLLAIAEEGISIPTLTLEVPDTTGTTTISFVASANTLVSGTVPSGNQGSSATNPYSGNVAASTANWTLQSTTGTDATKKEVKMPKGLKEILISVEFSVTFPLTSQ